jgi:hypothetical protein
MGNLSISWIQNEAEFEHDTSMLAHTSPHKLNTSIENPMVLATRP